MASFKGIPVCSSIQAEREKKILWQRVICKGQAIGKTVSKHRREVLTLFLQLSRLIVFS